MRRLVVLALIMTARGTAAAAGADPLAARHTDTVRLVERCLPSVVALRCLRQDGPNAVLTVGSGSVIHEAGYILTNDHVVGEVAAGDAILPGHAPLPFRLVARLPHEDMAVIKIDPPGPLPRLPLGRSADLMLGEPTLVIGNPDGIAHTVSTGIVSGLNRAVSTEHGHLPQLVQTNAAVSGGSSGGPLINAVGQLIGMISGKRPGGENLNFAIAIDHVRGSFPRLLAAEERCGFSLGMEVDMFGPSARVTGVATDSPAARAGVRRGDTVQRIDRRAVADGIDFHIALLDRRPGQTLSFDLDRAGTPLAADVTLAAFPDPDPVDIVGVLPGLRYAVFPGGWERLPDFASLRPAAVGTVDRVTLAPFESLPANFAVRFTGFIRVPADGLYTLFMASDDGSRLVVGDRPVVDNDGLHDDRESSGLVRLRAGLHPLRVEFFQGEGEKTLRVSIAGPNLGKRDLPPDMLFFRGEPSDAD